MAEPARQLRECPRIITTNGGKHLVTCGHQEPCPYHGPDHGPDLHLVRDDTLRIVDPAGEG